MKFHFCVFLEKKQRVDMYMSALFTEISRSYIQKMIDSGAVSVNGEKVKKNIKISSWDEILIEEIVTSVNLKAENIPLDIVFEDENIIVLNKQAWINVHPTPWIEGKSGTMVNALLYHCKNALPVISWEQRPGIVHRLDKDTSGAIMVAKNDAMMQYLSDTIKQRKLKKYYIAIVVWTITDKNFTIESEIGRDAHNRIKMTVHNPINPKHSITHGEVIGYIWESYTVVKIDLLTGRTHQIRVHLASIWFPIIGDSVYGDKDINHRVKNEFQLTRQALHAMQIEISLYGKQKIFFAPLKADMTNILESYHIILNSDG